jgi:hypothetical protein
MTPALRAWDAARFLSPYPARAPHGTARPHRRFRGQYAGGTPLTTHARLRVRAARASAHTRTMQHLAPVRPAMLNKLAQEVHKYILTVCTLVACSWSCQSRTTPRWSALCMISAIAAERLRCFYRRSV